MTLPPTVLGIDIGSTNTKAVLVDPARPGHVLATRAVATPTGADALVTAVRGLVRDLRYEADRPPAAVGITSMAETGALLVDGTPAGPLLRWQAGGTAALDDVPGLYAATGVPHPRKTPVAMLRALREAGDPRLTRGTRWAGVGDLVAHALTGRLATHPTLAARTLAYRRTPAGAPLPDAFDPDLLDPCGLRPDQLPQVLAPHEVLGRVRTADDGLAPGTPVVLAGHDHAVAAWAVGVRSPGGTADSLGTTEAVYGLAHGTPDGEAARRAGVSLAPDTTGAATAVLGAGATAGEVLAWFAAARGADLAALDPEAAALVARGPHAVVHPYLRGRQCPRPDPDARPGDLPDDDAHALAAVARGLALQARWLLETVTALAGPRSSPPVVVPGPLARSATWRAARDGLLGTPVATAGATQVAAAGAALRAAVLTGLAGPEATLPVSAPGPARTWPGADDVFAHFLATAGSPPHRKQDAG